MQIVQLNRHLRLRLALAVALSAVTGHSVGERLPEQWGDSVVTQRAVPALPSEAQRQEWRAILPAALGPDSRPWTLLPLLSAAGAVALVARRRLSRHP